MYDNIKITRNDFFETKIPEGTLILFNPPYGERINLGINDFYENIGNTLKNNYQGCTSWLISSDIESPSVPTPLNHSPEITLLFSGSSDAHVRLKFLSI